MYMSGFCQRQRIYKNILHVYRHACTFLVRLEIALQERVEVQHKELNRRTFMEGHTHIQRDTKNTRLTLSHTHSRL